MPQVVEPAHQAGQRPGIRQIAGLVIARHALHPVEIGAGREALALSGQHDGADAFVARQGVEAGA